MTEHLAAFLANMPGHRALVVGDLMLDRFIYGGVDRISPEAPIPVIRVERETAMMGGAGNVVRNLAAMGATVDVVGVTGRDAAGDEFAAACTALPGVTSCIIQDEARPTTQKTRYIAGSQQLLRADMENSAAVTGALEDEILRHIEARLPQASVIILSDYSKGVLTEKVVKRAIELARAAGKPILIDPKGRDYGRYHNAFMITPNRKELTEATGVGAIKTVEQAEQAARVLMTAYDIENVLAKLGGDGICLVPAHGPAVHIRGSKREIFDVSGAGDTVAAAMALSLSAGAPLADAAYIANLAGSIVVGKVGTATISVHDLQQELDNDRDHRAETKLLPRTEAAELVEKWRQQGHKVGFTNGCFDLLHPGHLASLRQARARCDRLIVGLNSDASVKRLKGESRPVQDEIARATVLSALRDVDLVVIFDEETPYDLIKTLHPTVLVKGSDYKPEQVVGWDLVQGWGGELHLVDLVAGHSTTSTIARMTDKAAS